MNILDVGEGFDGSEAQLEKVSYERWVAFYSYLILRVAF